LSEKLLELRDVAVRFDGQTVLDVRHLEVRRGEVLTLLGENGSGKTTLLRVLGLLIRPDIGHVYFCDEQVDFGNVRRLLELRRRMAAVMQEPLLCRMSVRRNVGLGLRFRGVDRQEADERVNAWLERLNISHLGERPAWKLSGGESQRTSLARAMVLKPEVLFLDEPFAALDAPTRQSQLQEFQAVLAESGVTAVFATHDRGEALGLGDRVAVLMQGCVAQVGSAEAVFTHPKHVDVARFVGVETLIPGRVTAYENGLAQVDCGQIIVESESNCTIGDEVHVAIRPEEVRLLDAGKTSVAGGQNTIACRVTKLVPAETHYRVELDCGFAMVAVIRRSRSREMGLAIGSRVLASFSPRAAHLINADDA
jgi:tungstate transport system ATP-binding protein